MTPRRPAPARPGVRPGTRRGARTASRSGPEQQTPPPDAAAPPTGPDSSTDRTDRGGQPPERTVLRLGGIDGMAVPAHAISLALVLLLAFVVVFPSLRGYLSQRARYDAVVNEIADARATSPPAGRTRTTSGPRPVSGCPTSCRVRRPTSSSAPTRLGAVERGTPPR